MVVVFVLAVWEGRYLERRCSEGVRLLKVVSRRSLYDYDLQLAWSLGPEAPGRERSDAILVVISFGSRGARPLAA